MKLKTVIVRRVFPIAAYGINLSAELEYQASPKETEEMILDHAKNKLENWHKQYEAQLNQVISLPVEIKTITEEPNEINQQFEALKRILEECPKKELAEKMLAKTEFRLNPVLNKIVNSKSC